MSKLKIGINGFGRIGRLVARICARRGIQICAINDPFLDVDYAKYLIDHDTIHGKFDIPTSVKNKKLVIGSSSATFFEERDPDKIPWAQAGAEIIIEATGKFTNYEGASLHLQGGAKKVIVTAPGKGMPMFVMGVNHKDYKNDMNVISNASCTTNCLAPLAKVINDAFGIEQGLMTTIHSTTATQLTVDGATKKDWRGGRAASYNIIPSSTGAAKAVGEVIPQLKGKLTGMSCRVPTLNVSVVDLTCSLKKEATYEQIVDAIKKSSKTNMKGVMTWTDDKVVSSDFIGEEHTCVFDIEAGIMLNPKFVKLFAWYDNEWGYSNKVVDLAQHINKGLK